MTKNLFIVATMILLLKVVRGFNYSAFFEKDGDNRDGKFLFDSLFGLEFEEELITNDATNTLKSCDCGEYLNGGCKWDIVHVVECQLKNFVVINY